MLKRQEKVATGCAKEIEDRGGNNILTWPAEKHAQPIRDRKHGETDQHPRLEYLHKFDLEKRYKSLSIV